MVMAITMVKDVFKRPHFQIKPTHIISRFLVPFLLIGIGILFYSSIQKGTLYEFPFSEEEIKEVNFFNILENDSVLVDDEVEIEALFDLFRKMCIDEQLSDVNKTEARIPDLPCDIEQVVDLLGIDVIRDTGTQLHCRCPFCADRKAHMNVKLRDNVFRCNRCGKGGGILHLYAEYCEVDLHTAYEELCKIFGPDGYEKAREYKRKCRPTETVELPIAPAEVRDNTYSNLLSLLTLCPTHQAALRERGLTPDEMERLCYRTTPTTRLKRIVTELLERGCILEGVPGFYCQKDTGQWLLDIRGSGIMLPDRNPHGQIEAIQIRLDRVYNQKFYNLTSVDQYYGTQSKCCPHYVGVHDGDQAVCLTEGIMKSDLAYSFALGSPYACGFVGLTGIPSYAQYERALEELDALGVKRINIMVDSDYQVKEEVRKARGRYIEMGAAAGFEMTPITWTQKLKGVDDLYKHLFRDK